MHVNCVMGNSRAPRFKLSAIDNIMKLKSCRFGNLSGSFLS